MLAAQSKLFDQKTLNIFSWICVIAILGLTVFLLTQQAWKKSALIVSVMGPSLYFIFVANKRVPALYVAIFVAVSLFNVVCMGWGLYTLVPYMDDFAHFATAFALVPCSVHALLFPLLEKFKNHKGIYVVFGLSAGLAVGSVWEILEYFLGIEASYHDTMTDLIFDGLGAGIASIWAALRLDKLGEIR